jgi:hypothetical protein
MRKSLERTRNFKQRIEIERRALSDANLFSEILGVGNLLGLSNAAIARWVSGLSDQVDSAQLEDIERGVRNLARATGLMSDESRCAVAERKVSSDFPELLSSFKATLKISR